MSYLSTTPVRCQPFSCQSGQFLFTPAFFTDTPRYRFFFLAYFRKSEKRLLVWFKWNMLVLLRWSGELWIQMNLAKWNNISPTDRFPWNFREFPRQKHHHLGFYKGPPAEVAMTMVTTVGCRTSLTLRAPSRKGATWNRPIQGDLKVYLPRWRFQPTHLKNMFLKLDRFPKDQGKKNPKNIWNHHLVTYILDSRCTLFIWR